MTQRADQAAVERLLTTMEFATAVRTVSEGADLGFAAPRASGTVTMGTLVARFVLGGTSPRPDGSSYFRVEGERPIVVSKELTEALLQGVDVYRDRSVVPYLSIDLARFSVSRAASPGGGFTLERIDERAFRVAEQRVAASRDAVESVWSALAEMRAESFPKDADVERLMASPRMTITMKPKDGRPEAVLVVGDACPGHPEDVIVLRKAPTHAAACAPKGAINALESAPSTLADRKPFSFRVDEMEEVRLEAFAGGEKPIEFARKGSGFHLREPEDRDLSSEEADAASELLARIDKVAADSVAPRSSASFEAMARAVVRGGGRDETIEVGRADAEGRVPLHRVRDDALLFTSRFVGRWLVPRKTSLASRVLLGDTRRVTRMLVACGVRQELVDDGAGFRLVSPVGYETDASARELSEALTRGRVEAWIADADDGTFGLETDACRVVLSFADGHAPAAVRFGAEANGAVCGSVEGQSPVFIASKALRDLAKKIYVSRASLRFDAATISRVRVSIDGRTVADPDLAAAKDALASLYADDVLRLGAPDVGRVHLAIDAGEKRIVCGASDARGALPCATPNVRAVFRVAASRLRVFLPADTAAPTDAGSDAGHD